MWSSSPHIQYIQYILEGGGSEEAGLASQEAEVEASVKVASPEVEAAAEAVEAGEAFKSLEKSAEDFKSVSILNVSSFFSLFYLFYKTCAK
jgi:hypothetical protein